MVDLRKKQLAEWAGNKLSIDTPTLSTVSGDASFRRYFRFSVDKRTIIAVDSPPESENNQAFYTVGQLLKQNGLYVPLFIHKDLTQGFFLLSDLGDRLYLPELTPDNADSYYSKAINTIIEIQQISTQDTDIPPYDQNKLRSELELFTDWFIHKHLKLVLSAEEKQMIGTVFKQLINNAKVQDQKLVHRDFHSRNLMICDAHTPGVIDFQDAVVGPLSYDLVSLIKDCYIEWSENKVRSWARLYHQKAIDAALTKTTFDEFFRQFELMGMQRHIKVLGIFCRLNYRDNKPLYLNDLPLTFKYLISAVKRYPEFNTFHQFLEKKVNPALESL
ncbi:aminoglycoside phosphotransferase family protein [Aliikangiella sp. IMCC44359]|uniref:aminoglycoside phosphotransferase family protein n=1 Tax=Aliikangiella sp. IMCC44359 TaxID=3459125 RepID=UPI00403ACC80